MKEKIIENNEQYIQALKSIIEGLEEGAILAVNLDVDTEPKTLFPEYDEKKQEFVFKQEPDITTEVKLTFLRNTKI